jgi:hypothetical protein
MFRYIGSFSCVVGDAAFRVSGFQPRNDEFAMKRASLSFLPAGLAIREQEPSSPPASAIEAQHLPVDVDPGQCGI